MSWASDTTNMNFKDVNSFLAAEADKHSYEHLYILLSSYSDNNQQKLEVLNFLISELLALPNYIKNAYDTIIQQYEWLLKIAMLVKIPYHSNRYVIQLPFGHQPPRVTDADLQQAHGKYKEHFRIAERNMFVYFFGDLAKIMDINDVYMERCFKCALLPGAEVPGAEIPSGRIMSINEGMTRYRKLQFSEAWKGVDRFRVPPDNTKSRLEKLLDIYIYPNDDEYKAVQKLLYNDVSNHISRWQV